LGFQYPIEIPGVSNLEFLRVSTNARREKQGKEEFDTFDFDDHVRDRLQVVQMDPAFLERSVNEGFSGGEKKRNEILQMALLDPVVAILDETDSGLDIDALRIVAGGVNQLASPDNCTLLITHYQRLLDEITPDYVHVMGAGRILRTGGSELAVELEKIGYDWVDQQLAAEGVA
jgi:Fe-S cluster assembly ATP-binding protein